MSAKHIEPDYDADMKLPDGKTCGDCVHIRRCLGIGYTSSETNNFCDFWPNRYLAKPEAPHA